MMKNCSLQGLGTTTNNTDNRIANPDQLDRQAQQLRDTQRRNDQLSERLEAVRAIERSLSTRPAPAASPSAPAMGNGSAPRPAP